MRITVLLPAWSGFVPRTRCSLGTRQFLITCTMSSFKKRAKSLKRTHRERGQVQACPPLARYVVCVGRLVGKPIYSNECPPTLAFLKTAPGIAGKTQGLCPPCKVRSYVSTVFDHCRVLEASNLHWEWKGLASKQWPSCLIPRLDIPHYVWEWGWNGLPACVCLSYGYYSK